ncbi:MAG: hypothetical protein IKC72_03505 [Clostridia bacterium]|nr:hypothetical protein [Clostridia bacterium]
MNKKKLNQSFLSLYEQFDKICCEKFGISTGGATEYINRLNNARFAPNRDEVLPKLVNFRNIRNRFAAEATLVKKSDEVSKEDIAWLRNFIKDLQKQRDPISAYLKKARAFARRRKFGKVMLVVGIVALVAAAAVAAWFFLK